MRYAVLAALIGALAVNVNAHYELTRPTPRGVDLVLQRNGPCGGYDTVQSPRLYSESLGGSIEVQLYWDGNVEVFIGFGDNPTTFPHKIGEQPNAKQGELYTIPIDLSKIPSSLMTANATATLQTVCHFSPTIDLFQCADLLIGRDPNPLPRTTTAAAPRPTLAAGTTVLNQDVRDAAIDFRSFLEGPKGCMMSETHMKETDLSRNLAALWLRAVFHDVATFDPNQSNRGGADGSLVHMLDKHEHLGINNSIATKFILNKDNNTMSSPDLIVLAGAVTVAHCGGPQMIFEAGRVANPNPVDPKGRVPEDTEPYDIVKARLKAMGMSDEDIVVLVVGGHSLGGAHKAISPHLTNETFQPFDTTPGIFDTDIFTQVLAGRCVTNIDCSIAADPALRPFLEKFAKDERAFFSSFESAYTRLTRLPQRRLFGLGGDGHEHLEIPVHANLKEEGTITGTIPLRTAPLPTATRPAATTTGTPNGAGRGVKSGVVVAAVGVIVGSLLV
ncbi:L-ascorbate peroxidase 1, cytosolic [Dinochytrium kinnereticum]|nr:L-ascorbate peroxidase 1, cytosolic [Dinochytrium kinnereticum]